MNDYESRTQERTATQMSVREAVEGAEILQQAGYTYHVEPIDQGGERYVRCEACGRELLVRLGGKDQLTHQSDCPNAGEA